MELVNIVGGTTKLPILPVWTIYRRCITNEYWIYNYATPIPCPECNKDGKAVRAETATKERELKQCNHQQP
ncbi:hypothetical protein DW622_04920 [Enterococcus faecalis]|nr:hypothetical protein [Enterococcus faecalis]